MNRIAIICEIDSAVARAVASRALREFPDELKGEKYAVVGWGSVLKIPVVKKENTPGGDHEVHPPGAQICEVRGRISSKLNLITSFRGWQIAAVWRRFRANRKH